MPYLNIYKHSYNVIKIPETKNPYFYMVLGGAMRLYTPHGIMDYVEGQYSVSSIDTPISGQVLIFPENNEFLTLSIEFTPDEVISVILDIDGDLPERILKSQLAEAVTVKADQCVISSVARLLGLVGDSDSLAFMAKHLKREIIFNALMGTCGKQLLQSVVRIQQADEIYNINNWIKQNYKS